MSARRTQRSAAVKAKEAITDTALDRTPRSRRTTSENVSMATLSRGPPSASSLSPQSMRLTVKTSSSKLRRATNSSTGNAITVNSREQFIGGEIIEGKRSRNVRKSYVLESDSDPEDEEDEDEEMEDLVDEDAEGEEIDDDEMGDEDADGDIDMDMEIPPPPPVIKVSRAQANKQTITARAPTKVDNKPIEKKEVEDGSDDDELSELDSDLGEEAEEEEAMQTGNEEDAEGEEEEIEAEDAEEDEEDLDSDDDTPAGGSRASTPDLNKLTVRQRARLEEGGSGHLLALPDGKSSPVIQVARANKSIEVQVKKHLTAEEHAMRRAEMARRRKNLSEKRNEEEKVCLYLCSVVCLVLILVKMETINKLLKKQAPKTNARRGAMNSVPGDSTPDSESQKANPLFVRWVSNKDGNRIGVPDEWLEGSIGSVFTNDVKQNMGGKLIQEVS